ncbi:MAG: 2-aminoethylphosphonate--pyruvate transaminase [Alphaproteobacteria bacterium]
MSDRPDPPILLTPGPLTTSAGVKAAMQRDWGSRDAAFVAMDASVRQRLLAIAEGGESHVCVPIQGSGTFAVEATLATLVPRTGKVLVLVNGAYGARIAKICAAIGRDHVVYETAEDEPHDRAELGRLLAADPAITHVAAIHCETTSGILNPIEAIAEVTAHAGRALVVDAMSAFGALPIDLRALAADAVIASANKCLQGAPGVGFALLRRTAIEGAAGNAQSLCLDLHDQFSAMERTGQWRFTPPTHLIAGLDQALIEHAQEGGAPGRLARYRENCRILVAGLRRLGLETLLADALQAPIIVSVHNPGDPAFDFKRFYDAVAARGYLLYPGKLTKVASFRVGCIGDLGAAEMKGALAAIEAALVELGVTRRGRQAGPG